MPGRSQKPYTWTERLRPPRRLEEAASSRQKARACGLSPNYWYIVDYADALAPGQVKEVVFWRRPIALFRGEDGEVHAVENCCAHRQLKLSEGDVQGSRLTCMYHGWTYEGDGKLVGHPHESFGRALPRVGLPSFKVKVRYGMIWLFPGDPALADSVPLPEIPEHEGPNAWPCVPIDFLWRAHHSMVLDNVSDYTHGWLHRKYLPFKDPKLLHHETVGDTVRVLYDAKIAAGRLMGLFVHRSQMPSNRIELCYRYPYHTSNTDDYIKHFISVLPIDERTSRVFALFYYRALRLPFTPFSIPKPLVVPMIKIGNRFIVKPIFDQDGRALELEQAGYEASWDSPWAEVNPIVPAFQALTVRKWEEYLASRELRPAKPAPAAAAPERS
jgi:phenylpropionate dioxygenase-like ring-hydroxylating dioxygenase large terminal subunit